MMLVDSPFECCLWQHTPDSACSIPAMTMMMARTSNCDVEPGVTPIWVVVIIRVWCIDGNHPIVAWPHDRNHPIC